MSQKKFRPLQDRLLVKRIEQEERSSGGIIIPDSAKEKPLEGEVVAVGEGKRLDNGQLQPIDVKPGDRVLFGQFSGSEITLDGNKHLVLRENEVFGVFA
jgi:chaperonin GroES